MQAVIRTSLPFFLLLKPCYGAWEARTLLGGDEIEPTVASYGRLFADPTWGTEGRVLILPSNLEITQVETSRPESCSVAYTPDPRLFYFLVEDVISLDSAPIYTVNTTGIGPELLTPRASVYVPSRGCRPPLLLSYGGSFVNANCSAELGPWFVTENWCFEPSFTTHVLRLDTLEWLHTNTTGPEWPGPQSEFLDMPLSTLGLSAAYDEVGDRVLMSGVCVDVLALCGCSGSMIITLPAGAYTDPDGSGNGQNTLYTISMSLSVLCDEQVAAPKPPDRAADASHSDGSPPSEVARWNSTLRIDLLRWIQPLAPQNFEFSPVSSLGFFGYDPVRERLIQSNGIDFTRCHTSSRCFVANLSASSADSLLPWDLPQSCDAAYSFGPSGSECV